MPHNLATKPQTIFPLPLFFPLSLSPCNLQQRKLQFSFTFSDFIEPHWII